MTAKPIPKVSASPSKYADGDGITASERIYRCAVLFVLLFALAHVVSLPMVITYDGLEYTDMAQILGSNRFPHDWYTNRTPLFPLALKVSLWMFGGQPLAPIVLGSTVGVIGILALGSVVRRMAGALAAAACVVLVSLSPTLVTYEHAVLTEAGSFCLLMLICRIAFQDPQNERGLWFRAALLALTFAAGYYWRQTILSLTPAVAGVLFWREWAAGRLQERRHTVAALGRIAVIVFIPILTAQPWARYVQTSGLRDVSLRQGMIRQALLPPEDPFVGNNAEFYMQAIRDSIRNGNYYSGMTWDRLTLVSERVFARPLPDGTPRFFLYLIRRYPSRYLNGLGRTLLLFAGVKGVESDNRAFRSDLLGRHESEFKIGPAPDRLRELVEKQYRNSTPSFPGSLLRWAAPLYDRMLVWASLLTLMGLAVALWRRDLQLLLFCGLPLTYILGYAVILVSIDRFMVPVYPMMISNLVVVPLALWRVARKSGSPI